MKKLEFGYWWGFTSEIRKHIGKIALLGGLIFLYCCTPKLAPSSAFSESDVARGKVFWSDCSIQKLDAAHTLYTNKCATCHSLKAPASEDEAGWRKIVPPMAKKAKLSAEEESQILNYVLTMREAKK